MDNFKNDSYFVELIKDDIDRVLIYTKDLDYKNFVNNDQLIDAVLFRLIQITENIKKLSLEYKENNPNISWNKIVGFRNRIVHDYGKTDYSIVYEVITKDLKELKELL